LSKVAATDITTIVCPLLQELVNYGTGVLARCMTDSSYRKDIDLAIVALYRHVLEMTDGTEVLLAQACANPAIPLVRSSFEALLYIKFITEHDESYERRSLAWLVNYVHLRLDMYERLDPSTAKGLDFATQFSRDIVCRTVLLPAAADARQAMANLKIFLDKPGIQPVEAEFTRVQKGKWYSMFGGPQNLRELAKSLRCAGQYDVLYRRWSRTAHAEDLLALLGRNTHGEPAIRRLRNTSQVREVASFASAFALGATIAVLGKLRPGENVRKWYLREVRPLYDATTGGSRSGHASGTDA
jgi:hypothetical protein